MGEHEKMRNTGIKECAHRLNTDVRIWIIQHILSQCRSILPDKDRFL